MIVDLLTAKETTMYHADNPLHREIIASFNDPDPDHAFRYRPFVYGSRRRHLDLDDDRGPRLSLRPGERVRALFGTVSRIMMPWRVECAPCCTSPCS
jgi:hypothetical protein